MGKLSFGGNRRKVLEVWVAGDPSVHGAAWRTHVGRGFLEQTVERVWKLRLPL